MCFIGAISFVLILEALVLQMIMKRIFCNETSYKPVAAMNTVCGF
mgnify:FL=1